MNKVDDRTKIPIFAVISSIPFFVGGMIWLTNIAAKADQANIDIKKQEDVLKEQAKILIEVRDSVIRIEERMNKTNN